MRQLRALARECGVQDVYADGMKQRRTASPEALLAVLRCLGVPIESAGEASEHRRRIAEERAGRLCEPVVVAWQGEPAALRLSVGGDDAVEVELEEDGGRRRGWSIGGSDADVERVRDGLVWRGLPRDLAAGAHRLRVRRGGQEALATLLAAPARCYEPGQGVEGTDKASKRGGGGGTRPEVGLFLPLYAAQSARSAGIGDVSDLSVLMEWAGEQGCGLFGTLPLLTCFLDEPFDPSPYAPISRLLFGEIFIDIEAAGGAESAEVKRLLESPGVREELRRLRAGEVVDYARVWALKRRALEAAARGAFADERLRAQVEGFAREVPLVEAYANFRGAMARLGAAWRSWPAPARGGRLARPDVDEDERRLFLYAQWRLEAQVHAAAERGGRAGCSLYMDLPIGVHGGGFDAWQRQHLFASGAALGAPPDAFFAGGQCWGFPPVIPEASRRDGHAYFAESVARHLTAAAALRIDHVAGLHRCFWVPEGMSAEEGVYVRQPAEEFYAILSIASHRAGAAIIGENLGTVPREVNRSLRRRGVLGMSIAQFELGGEETAVPRPGGHTLCALNTHDMAPFASFWSGKDIDRHVELGLFDAATAGSERQGREKMRTSVLRALGLKAEEGEDAPAVAKALLERLRESDAAILLVNLEDLWGEMRPHNVPGMAYDLTWRRRAARSVERIVGDDALRRVVQWLSGACAARGPSGGSERGRVAGGRLCRAGTASPQEQ